MSSLNLDVMRREMWRVKRSFFVSKRTRRRFLLWVAMYIAIAVSAQDGNTGINQANTLVRSYFDAGTQLMYAVGAILALIGAVRVFQLWGSPNGEAGRAAAGWFGSCVFLVVVSTIIKAFFGL